MHVLSLLLLVATAFTPVTAPTAFATRNSWHTRLLVKQRPLPLEKTSTKTNIITPNLLMDDETKVKIGEDIGKKLSKEQLARLEELEAYSVVLHNDSVNTFDFVTGELTQVIPQLTREEAYNLALEAHQSGRVIVFRTWEARGKSVCTALLRAGLRATLET